MKKKRNEHYRLVITAALKKEFPVKRVKSRGIPVHTLKALRSGALKAGKREGPGVLVVITGVGPKASRDAAEWIKDNLAPYFVINIGTCGVLDKDLPLGEWYCPSSVYNAGGDNVGIDTRLPMSQNIKCSTVGSLLTVKRAISSELPEALKEHRIVDMEAYEQANVFKGSGISFHCIKAGTDRGDRHAENDFTDNLNVFREMTWRFMGELVLGDDIKISVVIPVYKRADTIKRAIDSVLAQSYRADEIIVVDDGSTDRTLSVLKGYGKQIRLITLSENAGPSRARNEGVRFAKNEWIAFLDSDDEWEKHKLKKQVEHLRSNPYYQITQTDEKWIRNGVRVNRHKHHDKSEGWIMDSSLERCMISPSAVLVKRSLLGRFGYFNEDLPACEDYDLWLKITRHHPVGLERSTSVIKYGGHEDQQSRKYEAMDRFRVSSLKKMLDNETEKTYRDKIASVLKRKLNVLIKGCIKRGKIDEAEMYRAMLDEIEIQNNYSGKL
ncbi:MAG: glycosyltransferase [Nitrospirota bacterium]|nr:MAG: glycosyltransferase [Nitrospirota bacterium]